MHLHSFERYTYSHCLWDPFVRDKITWTCGMIDSHRQRHNLNFLLLSIMKVYMEEHKLSRNKYPYKMSYAGMPQRALAERITSISAISSRFWLHFDKNYTEIRRKQLQDKNVYLYSMAIVLQSMISHII